MLNRRLMHLWRRWNGLALSTRTSLIVGLVFVLALVLVLLWERLFNIVLRLFY